MKGTGGTRGTGTGPVPTGPLSVNDAAELLGITPRAVRKRIHAGTLMGEQIDGQWVVYPHAVQQGRTPRNPVQGRRAEEPRPWTPELTEDPPQAIAAIERLVAPLMAQITTQGAQIGDLREQLGRERTLREQAEARAARLEQQVRAPHTAPAETATPPASPSPPHPGNARSRVLRWLADHLA